MNANPLALLDEKGALAGTHLNQRIEVLEDYLRTLPQVGMTLKHYFGLNTYARELSIPKDTIVTGMIHKTQQISILSKGDVSVLTDKGMVRVQAPFTYIAPPGTKRVVYTHEDSIWTTILGTPLKDPEEILKQFCADTDEEYRAFLLEQPPTVERSPVEVLPIIESWKPRLELKPAVLLGAS